MGVLRNLWTLYNEYVPTRYVMIFMAFLGTTNIYAMRVNLNVAIVAMAKERRLHNDSLNASCPAQITSGNSSSHHNGEFDWDEQTQGMILSSFFWGYICTQMIGGRLAEAFSGKWVYGGGILTTAILTLITPLLARWGTWFLVGGRIVEGLFEGVTYPAAYSMLAKWSPPLERSQMMSLLHLGNSLGAILAAPISGLLMAIPLDGGWPLVFYFFGTCGVIWFVFWALIVDESPASHPRIPLKEREYILTSLKAFDNKKKLRVQVPWKAIWTSVPMWTILVAHFGFHWGFNTLLTELPTYLKSVLHFDTHSSAMLSAVPYVGKVIFTILTGFVADFLRRRKILSTVAVRKIANSIASFLPAICFTLIPFVGCDKMLAVVVLVLASTFQGSAYSAFYINHVDIAPQFAGTLMGITNTAGTIPGIVAPYFVGTVTNHNSTIDSWAIVFYVAAAIHAVTNVVYIFFAQAELQPWSTPTYKDDTMPLETYTKIENVDSVPQIKKEKE